MIDLKDLRENPDKYRRGAAAKGVSVDLDALLELDGQLRTATTEREQLAAEKNKISKEIGQVAGKLKKATDEEKAKLSAQMQALQARPNEIKEREGQLDAVITALEPKRDELWLQIPLPPDADVPAGKGSEDNVELRRWNPTWFDTGKSFAENKGFAPKTHVELGAALGLFDVERGVKMAGTRSYVLSGAGMRLHQAALRLAFDYMVNENGFTPLSVPVLVRDEMMVGTGFFPHGKEQAYEIKETQRGGGYDLYLTGTGEVGLMGYHQGEIIDGQKLPLCYTTVSTCFRREAGAAGKDTAGLYRIHQFDKVEQVVINKADEQESRAWHKKMLGFVEQLMQRLELPYRLLQCCTGDLGPKNADMIDIESWMPGRGPLDEQGRPRGEYGETHSASRLYDYQCRRLNMRYRDAETKKVTVCHSLNNTVLASPRILIPILEMYQNADGSVTVPKVLRPYMNGQEKIG
ncbi:MAG: serine--tRNA ligase [Phycisphaeraceae bacterium]|nr:serine--tRNA ligase [Phycisphaeraceae bacterium]